MCFLAVFWGSQPLIIYTTLIIFLLPFFVTFSHLRFRALRSSSRQELFRDCTRRIWISWEMNFFQLPCFSSLLVWSSSWWRFLDAVVPSEKTTAWWSQYVLTNIFVWKKCWWSFELCSSQSSLGSSSSVNWLEALLPMSYVMMLMPHWQKTCSRLSNSIMLLAMRVLQRPGILCRMRYVGLHNISCYYFLIWFPWFKLSYRFIAVVFKITQTGPTQPSAME